MIHETKCYHCKFAFLTPGEDKQVICNNSYCPDFLCAPSKQRADTCPYFEERVDEQLNRVLAILEPITMEVMGKPVMFRVERDAKDPLHGRIFLQIIYIAPCTKTGRLESYKGRKWYLSDHMIDDEIVKTCYAAFKAAVEHEVMEGFKYDGKTVFNPHASYETLLSVSDMEVSRTKHEQENTAAEIAPEPSASGETVLGYYRTPYPVHRIHRG